MICRLSLSHMPISGSNNRERCQGVPLHLHFYVKFCPPFVFPKEVTERGLGKVVSFRAMYLFTGESHLLLID